MSKQASSALGFVTTLPLSPEQTRVAPRSGVAAGNVDVRPAWVRDSSTNHRLGSPLAAAETWWLSDAGVRYGLVSAADGSSSAPRRWGCRRCRAVAGAGRVGGRTGIVKRDALVAHDTLAEIRPVLTFLRGTDDHTSLDSSPQAGAGTGFTMVETTVPPPSEVPDVVPVEKFQRCCRC